MPISRLVVIADAHLGAYTPDAEPALLRFLDAVPALGDGLLVAGDLFDFWFGYREVVPRRGLRVLAALAALARQVPVQLIGGNHDRWGDAAWADELALSFAPRVATLEVGGARVLATHGDAFGAMGPADRLLHALVDSPLTSALYRALPSAIGLPVVRRLAPSLGDHSMSPATLDRASATQAAGADRLLAGRRDVAWLVTGHTHRAVLRTLPSGQRHLNPGAWFDGGRYAVLTADDAELRTFH